MIRAFARAAFYVAWVVAVVAAVNYFAFWRPFVAELRDREQPEKFDIGGVGEADPELIRLVGGFATKRKSSFINFETAKPAGTERVCAFGDSYTYGDEVKSRQDFPSQLQRLYREAGLPVEVLNFGSSWHGFHQTFLIWQRLAPRYACDVVLLGPHSFWPDRDTEFNHTDMISPYFVHARFVIEGGGLRLIEVLGADYRERFDEYWSFIPRWRYLRYDRNPPAFLLAPIPSGRSVANPFYYRSDSPEEEAKETWQLLLRDMVAAEKSIVMSQLQGEMVDFAKSLGADGLRVMSAWQEHRFPYAAPKGHFSAFANHVIAQQFFAALVPGSERVVPLLVSRSPDPLPAGDPLPLARKLSEYSVMAVEIEGREIGWFATAAPHFSRRGNGSRAGVHQTNVKSFVAITQPGESLMDAAYVQIRHPLSASSELRLRVGSGADAPVHSLGSIAPTHPNLQIGRIELSALHFAMKEELVLTSDAPAPFRRDVPLTLLVDDEPVLESSGAADDGRVVFRPVGGWVRQITTAKVPSLDVEKLPQRGVYTLRLEHPEDGPSRLPLAIWSKVRVELPGV